MLMENAIKHTKDVFIQFLRLLFNNKKNYYKKLPPQISEDHYTEAVFYDSEPEVMRQFPCVIITASSGNMITAGLGDMCCEIKDVRTGSTIGFRYQGFYEFTLVIDIACRNPLDREVFTDLVAKALRWQLRRFIQNQGIIIKDLSYAGETTLDYNSDKIYVSQLRVNTWSTWVEDVDLLDPDEFTLDMSMSTVNDNDKRTVINSGYVRHEENGENEQTEIVKS